MTNTFDRIYAIVRQIPYGKVATYGQISILAGNPHWSRVVGYALHTNPYPWNGEAPDDLKIPCHRVVNRYGEISDAFAFGGANIQHDLLISEGVEFLSETKVHLEKYIWNGK